MLYVFAEPFEQNEETQQLLTKVIAILDVLEEKYHIQSFDNITRRNAIYKYFEVKIWSIWLLLVMIKALLLTAQLFFQTPNQSKDSVSVRLYNNSKYDIVNYTIIVDKVQYTFKNILPQTYSTYKKLPYLYFSHQKSVNITKKRFLNPPINVTITSIPIDHVGEKKINTGSSTLWLDINKKNKRYSVETKLKNE